MPETDANKPYHAGSTRRNAPRALESSPLPVFSEGASANETEAILFALARAVEQRDSTTASHCERLAVTSVALGAALHLDRSSLGALYRGGYLHDIGKVGIPDAILFKPGPLTAEEWVVMRSHTIRGQEICCHVKSLGPVLPIIRHHHERWDGSGYPDGLRGSQIPLLSRVVQVADIYDALTSARPYKPAYSPRRALEILEEETERGWRDPEVIQMFLHIHGAVISKVDEYTRSDDGGETMRAALDNLDDVLRLSEIPLSAISRLPASKYY